VRLVLDTNTVVSGLLWNGTPGRLIDAAVTKRIAIVSSVPLLSELRDVLGRKKFCKRRLQLGFSDARLFALYLPLVTIVQPAVIELTVKDDPADDAVLAAALGGNADLIVPGDAHLLNIKCFKGIDIVAASIADLRIRAARS
jgi:putative PIN family toxin of toxin-antitoxin system